VYSYFVDDQASGFTSRIEGRKHLDEQLLAPFIVAERSETPGTMTKEESDRARQEKLRATWGHDEEAQRRWAAGR
jgi:hypothetical protein